MPQHFTTIQAPSTNSKLVLSSLKKFEQRLDANSPSVKLVLSGTEHYHIDGRHSALQPGRLLIVDSQSQVALNIHARQPVTGLCLFPGKALLNEVARAQTSAPEHLLDTPLESSNFALTQQHTTQHEQHTGRFVAQHLPQLLAWAQGAPVANMDAFYYGLAECLVTDQQALTGQLKRLPSIKKATREELLHRVATARMYAEANYTRKLTLDELAQVACLSKYHFTRTFQAVYRCSPYQYLLRLRLDKAQQLLGSGYSYQQASDLVGFSDANNLRKALKKHGCKRN